MRKSLSLLIGILTCVSIFAQVPDAFNYQAVVRNSNGDLIISQSVSFQISILQGSATGTSVYVETHIATTNEYGLVSLEIGNGTSVEDFLVIDWGNGPYFMQIEMDASGGSDYQLLGTSQLLSLPYALHAKTADSITGTLNEIDPVFEAWDKSTGISITESQISDLDHFTSADETDPIFDASTASGITSIDTSYWNHKLDSYIETDPVFTVTVAADITSVDTAFWNDKSEFDGDFSSLYNAPNIANTTLEKNIQLNTNDATSSVNITKNNGASILKVDGTGRITGDGSGLSNVKPLLNYTGGDQRYQITANYGSYNNVRSVTMTAPSSGVCFVIASGYIDWESTGWDLLLAGILCDQDPNSSWDAEDEWYDYLNIITDYNCPDSSDQYTSFSQHRCIPVSAGTHTFYLWANKHSAAAKTEVADVNISVMFFPTGGTGKSSNDAMIKEEEPAMVIERIPNTVAGYK